MKSKFFTGALHFFLRPVLLAGFISQYSFSQWSTSTNADSALFVCPGYTPSIITFDDGSSIICGALSDYRYVQKLDPYGYKVWAQPVLVYYTPGTEDIGLTGMVHDEDGGVILWWHDHRGAQIGPPPYYLPISNAIYMQRVDKNGNVRWQTGGIQVAPVDSGSKGGYGVADGQGGIVLYMSERLFDSTVTLRWSRTSLVRYESNGQKSWSRTIDSSESELLAGQPIELCNRLMIGTQSGLKFFEPITGNLSTPPAFVPHGAFVVCQDSVAYNLETKQDKIDSSGARIFVAGVTQVSWTWDSVWYSEYQTYDEANDTGYFYILNSLVPKGADGLFNVWSFTDKYGRQRTRAQWITKDGPRWPNGGFDLIGKGGGGTAFSGKNSVGLYFWDGTALAIDTSGRMLWDTNYTVTSNSLDTYAEQVASDNNGGAIITFWTTMGGIYAQHTGRTGKVGVITKVKDEQQLPTSSELFQNYPNPFNPTTTIRFSVAANGRTILKVYDVLGREVTTLVDTKLDQGRYEVVWRTANVSSGVYFCVLKSNDATLTKKMILVR